MANKEQRLSVVSVEVAAERGTSHAYSSLQSGEQQTGRESCAIA